MSTPIEWTRSGSGEALVTRIAPKVDPGTEDHHVWTIDLAVEEVAEDGKALAASFPGFDSYHRKAVDNLGSADLKVRPAGKDVHLTFATEGGEPLLDDRKGELKFVKIRLTSEVQVQVARVVLHSVPLADAEAVVGMLGKRVQVSVMADQGDLFEATTASTDALPEPGQVVTGVDVDGNLVVGRVTQRRKDGIRVDDFGAQHKLDEVMAAVWVESVDATPADEHLARYQAEAGKMGIAPTWSALIETIGAAAADGAVQAPGSSTHYINAAVIDRAVRLAEADIPEPV